MSTITIRADDELRHALRENARAQGRTVSEMVREILTEALVDRPLSARAGHLKGSLDLPAGSSDSWREEIRERNWRR